MKYITIEGPDCSGKTFVFNKIKEDFANEYKFLSFPTQPVRDIITNNQHCDFNKLIIDDHIKSKDSIINSDRDVISDRSILSLAYQILFYGYSISSIVEISKSTAIPNDAIILHPGIDIIRQRLDVKHKDAIEQKLTNEKIDKLYDLITILAIKLQCNIHVVKSVEFNYIECKNIIKGINV